MPRAVEQINIIDMANYSHLLAAACHHRFSVGTEKPTIYSSVGNIIIAPGRKEPSSDQELHSIDMTNYIHLLVFSVGMNPTNIYYRRGDQHQEANNNYMLTVTHHNNHFQVGTSQGMLKLKSCPARLSKLTSSTCGQLFSYVGNSM